ncbi:hypothetical protein CY35_13G021300 [Sphagnum magellanicum]|nr:hypothetical protein CY35_13G021300 [Sphagnum magellanicum]
MEASCQDASAIVESHYDEQTVGCAGNTGGRATETQHANFCKIVCFINGCKSLSTAIISQELMKSMGSEATGLGPLKQEIFQQVHSQMEVDNWMYTGDVNVLDNLIAVPMRLYDISSIHGRAHEEGRGIHTQVTQSGWESNVHVGSSLVDKYAKCGSMEEAWRVFHKLTQSGSAECMCASLFAPEQGRCVHEQTVQNGYESDVFVGSSLINIVFDRTPTCDVAMMVGSVKCGQGQKALELFHQMQWEGVHLVPGTFIGVIIGSASVSELEEDRHVHEQITQCGCGVHYEGLHYFESMSSVHWISARVEHCACLVHPFGRAGHLDEVEDLVKSMPCEPDTSAWSTVLAACRVHCNVEMGEPFAN